MAGVYRLTDKGLVYVVQHTGPMAAHNRLRKFCMVGCYKCSADAQRFLFNEIKTLHLIKGRIGEADPFRPLLPAGQPLLRPPTPEPEPEAKPAVRLPALAVAAAAAKLRSKTRAFCHCPSPTSFIWRIPVVTGNVSDE